MEGNLAATYTLVYRFLKQQSQNKAAEAVKKAAKTVVVLRDDLAQEGPALEDVVREWKSKQNTKAGNRIMESSSEESGSSDDSSSDSEDDSDADSSSDSESDDDDASSDESDNEIKKAPQKQKPAERDTSVTLSSAGDNGTKTVDQIPEDKSTKHKDASSSDDSDSDSSAENSTPDSSDAESSSDSSGPSDKHEVTKKTDSPKIKTTKDEGSSTSTSSSSSESEDESESESDPQLKEDAHVVKMHQDPASSSESDDESESEPPQKKDPHVAQKRETSESSLGSEDELASEPPQKDVPIAKKRKTSEVAAVTIAVATGSQRKDKPPAAAKERFQRVKVQSLAPELFMNNGYTAKGGTTNDYGERAHRDLIMTRGAGFRKEKNKKKRGSYRGGEITMENHSIKFDF